MKKTLLILSISTLFLVACGGGTNENQTSTETTTPVATKKGKMQPGELLIVKSDCVGCHKIDEKIIGPSYQEIAEKYTATDENIALLATKIIQGGKGVWGPIPMTPHTKITEDEAKTMVKYILSLKK